MNEINNLNQQQVTSEPTINRPLLNQIAQNKDVLLALAKIQVGDILSGRITQEGQQTILKLTTGLKLAAQLNLDIVSDQLQDFLVTGKNNHQIEIEPLLVNRFPQKEMIEDSVVKEMQLPNNADMKDLVGQWMDKQLPLLKNQLMQTYQLAKNYDMPTELFTNLKSNEVSLNPNEVELVSEFKEKGLETILHTVEDIFEGLNQEETIDLTTKLSQHLSKEEVKTMLTSMNLSKSDTSQLSKKEFNALLEHVFDQTNEATENTSQINSLKTLFSQLSKSTLKTLSKEVVKKYIAVQQDEDKEPLKEMQKLEESSKRLKSVTDDMKPYAKDKGIEQTLQKLDQTAQVLQKYQQEGQYYCFPLQIKDQNASGELYFFKPKKKKGVQEAGMYIVLALDMPSLKHIEIHLKEQNDKLGLRIKVANDRILEQIETHKEKLESLLEDTVIPVSTILVERLETSIAKQLEQSHDKQLSRLDFKV